MRRLLIVLFIPIYLILSIPHLLVTYVFNLFNRDLTRRSAYLFCRSYALGLMFLTGARFNITGLDHIDTQKNYLFVANHKSLLDSPVLMILSKKPLSFISKEEMQKTPILRGWMHLLYCLFLNRDNNREGLKTILQGIENMKLGDSLAIFPQGTRSKNDDFLPFKAGSFKLASKSNSPILPIAIYGTDNVFENNGFNIKANNVHIHIFQPIETKDLSREDLLTLPKDIESMIHNKFNDFQTMETNNL